MQFNHYLLRCSLAKQDLTILTHTIQAKTTFHKIFILFLFYPPQISSVKIQVYLFIPILYVLYTDDNIEARKIIGQYTTDWILCTHKLIQMRYEI